MVLFRTLMRDRSSAGAIAMLAALLFLLQGLVGGFAHGAMAAQALDPAQIICSMHGTSGQSDGQTKPGTTKSGECCTAACRIFSMASQAILSADSVPVEVALVEAATRSIQSDDRPQPQRRRLLSQARAPPLSVRA